MTKWRGFLICCIIRMGFLLGQEAGAMPGRGSRKQTWAQPPGGLGPASGEVICNSIHDHPASRRVCVWMKDAVSPQKDQAALMDH